MEDNEIDFIEIVKRNLKSNLIIKSYRVLCSLLKEKVRNGDSQKSQFKKWGRYFKWEKVEGSNQIKIIEIFDAPREEVKIEVKKEKYTPDDVKSLEKVNINLLVQSEGNHVTIPKNLLLELLYMVNTNYKKYNYNTIELSEKTNIKKQDIDEFYSLTNKMLKENLVKSLNNLYRKNMIFWKTIWIVKLHKIDSDKEAYREATKNEYEFIMKTKDDVLKKMGLVEEWQVYTYNRWKEYTRRVDEILLDQKNIEFFYEAYDIVMNREKIAREWYNLTEEEKMIEKSSVNSGILEKVLKLAQDRNRRAIEVEDERGRLGVNKDGKIRRRVSSTYMYNYEQLGEMLLDKKTKEL